MKSKKQGRMSVEEEQIGKEAVDIQEMLTSEMSKFLQSKEDFYEFFINQAGCYMPPYSQFTIEFGRQVLSKEKMLFKNKMIKPMWKPRQDKEIKTPYLYNIVKAIPSINQYLPDYPKSMQPDRNFLCTIINSARPGLMKKLILDLKKLKFKKKQEQFKRVIHVSEEWSKLLKEFKPSRELRKRKRTSMYGKLSESRLKERKPRKKRFSVDFKIKISKKREKELDGSG